MLSGPWTALADEIERWQQQGRTVEFWWRDDDAFRPDPALSRLLALAIRTGVPLALAVVPHRCEAVAFERLDPLITVIQHGVDHRNRAADGQKKNEFPPSEPLNGALDRLAAGFDELSKAAAYRSLPVLAPPWNRLSPALVPVLAKAGYSGLSRFGPRDRNNVDAPGLVQVNTHVDVIDWKGGRGFCGVESALAQAIKHLAAKRAGSSDPLEPTGWLTHHAVHDEATWDFLEGLLERTAAHPGIRWRAPASLFGTTPSGGSGQ